MPDLTIAVVALCGCLLAGGLFLVGLGLRGRPPRLDDALASLAGQQSAETVERVEVTDEELLPRLGAWAFTRLRLPLSARSRQLLALRGRSIGDFVAEKLLLVLLGLATPLLATAALQGMGQLVRPVPLVASIACAVVGWVWPDVALRRSDEGVRADAGEALYTYFDLVTLERLANASASQAMLQAASLSDSVLFTRLRTALERSRLEQRPPWQELHRLSQELSLPQIADIADVMRLDEQGAALTPALRARVAELRDAHLGREKLAAQQVSERMTVWMVIPSMIFGLAFLTPPILTLLGLG